MGEDGGPEMLDALGGDALAALQKYADAEPAEFMQVVRDIFDISGEQEAVTARLIEVTKLTMKHGHVVARVHLSIAYRNPVEPGETDLGAENTTTDAIDVRFAEHGADLTVEGIEPVIGEAFAG
jgi:hypothetical protein